MGIELIAMIAAIYCVLKVPNTLPELYFCSSSNSQESLKEVLCLSLRADCM